MNKEESDGRNVLIWAIVILFLVAAVFGGRGDQALFRLLALATLGGMVVAVAAFLLIGSSISERKRLHKGQDGSKEDQRL